VQTSNVATIFTPHSLGINGEMNHTRSMSLSDLELQYHQASPVLRITRRKCSNIAPTFLTPLVFRQCVLHKLNIPSWLMEAEGSKYRSLSKSITQECADGRTDGQCEGQTLKHRSKTRQHQTGPSNTTVNASSRHMWEHQIFEVLTAVNMSVSFFWVATPCRLAGRYQHFGGIYCLFSPEDEGSMFLRNDIYRHRSTWRYYPEAQHQRWIVTVLYVFVVHLTTPSVA
jgi:hypothetical protein